jgi:D-sedoheptulose 7-phosphate isomerase
MNFSKNFLRQNIETIKKIDTRIIEKMVKIIFDCKKKEGRLFFIGVGGSAAHCSHSVNDFRKLCNLQAFTPTDNVSELTARINDEGWDNSYKDYLVGSKISKKDVLIIYSVGGGSLKKKVSVNIVNAIKLAKKNQMKIISIIGKKDGFAAKNSSVKLIFDISEKKNLTPITEGLTSVVWHLLVTHPKLKSNKTKW